MQTLHTLSLMERILFLKRVPLFANLPPAELKQVAAIADEHLFVDGEVMAQQDEPGEELYVIVSGNVTITGPVVAGKDSDISGNSSINAGGGKFFGAGCL